MKTIFIQIATASCLALVGACGSKTEPAATEKNTVGNTVELTDAQLQLTDLQTGKIQRQSISSLLKVNGSIDVPPQNIVTISAPLGGYLKSTSLLPGMHIKKGERIATMEDPQYITLQQEYLTAKAQLTYAEIEFKRQEELNKTKAVSDKVLQEAQLELTTKRVTVKSLSEKLKLIGIDPDHLSETNLSRSININSPIDGYVSKVNANIGKYVNPADVLFELVNPTDIHLALNVFEKDIDKLAIGQKLVAYTNNSDTKYPCSILLIGKNLNENRSVEVHCHFDVYDKALIPGMFMNADIEVQSNNALVIPSDAIIRFEGEHYVFIQTAAKKYTMQRVITRNSENGLTQIEFPDGVDRSNALFVTKGAYTLFMKMKNVEEE